MAFDAATFAAAFAAPAAAPVIGGAVPVADLIDAAGVPCPEWAARNPDRALARLFVAPADCEAVDVLMSL